MESEIRKNVPSARKTRRRLISFLPIVLPMMKPLLSFLNHRVEKKVIEFFDAQHHDPATGVRTISGQRYHLVSAEAIGYHIRKSAEKIVGRQNAKLFVREVGRAVGKAAELSFHQKFHLNRAFEGLAGPIYFNYAGFASFNILPESKPTPSEEGFSVFDHPHSLEAEAQLRKEGLTDYCVCHLVTGYSSGWTESNTGLRIDGEEISCIAKGDDRCRFIMANPAHMEELIDKFGVKS